MKDILVSPTTLRLYGPQLQALLDPSHRLVALDPGRTDLSDVEVAFLSSDFMDRGANAAVNPDLAGFLDAICAAPRLRWIHICSAGADRQVLRDLMAKGVLLTTSAGANAKSVAHAAIAGMMAMERNVPQWVRDTDARRWTPRNEIPVPAELGGSRATILGTGPIGSEIAKICQAFEMKVTGIKRSAGPQPHFDEVATFDDIDKVLPRTDWLFIACPLSPLTRGLISAERFALLAPGARMINIARGPIVVEDALSDALRSGRLAGAYSDVFAVEPLPAESPLWSAPNLLISSHTAGRSSGFNRRTTEMFEANLQRWIAGEPLSHLAS